MLDHRCHAEERFSATKHLWLDWLHLLSMVEILHSLRSFRMTCD